MPVRGLAQVGSACGFWVAVLTVRGAWVVDRRGDWVPALRAAAPLQPGTGHRRLHVSLLRARAPRRLPRRPHRAQDPAGSRSDLADHRSRSPLAQAAEAHRLLVGGVNGKIILDADEQQRPGEQLPALSGCLRWRCRWVVVSPWLPNLHEVLDGIFHVVDNGATWRAMPHDLPHDLPPWATCYRWMRCPQDDGTWQRMVGLRICGWVGAADRLGRDGRDPSSRRSAACLSGGHRAAQPW